MSYFCGPVLGDTGVLRAFAAIRGMKPNTTVVVRCRRQYLAILLLWLRRSYRYTTVIIIIRML